MAPKLQQPWYLVILAVFAGLAVALGGPLAWGGLWFWVLVGATDLAWSGAVGRQLAVLYRASHQRFTRGDPMQVEVELSNEGWIFAPTVALRDEPGAIIGFGTGPGGRRCTLWPQQRITFRHQVTARRGQYRLGPLELSAEGPFGVFRVVRSLYSESEVTVLPRLAVLPYWPLEQAEAHGNRARRRSPYTDPATVIGVRPMLPGDSPRFIHWKRTARTGTLQVRESEPSAGGSTLIILDLASWSYRGTAGEQALDAAIEIGAAIGHSVLQGSGELMVIGTADRPLRIGPLRGSSAVAELLSFLAMADADGQLPLGPWLEDWLLRPVPHGVVVLVTPEGPSSWVRPLLTLRGRGATVASVLVASGSEDFSRLAPDCETLERMGCPAWVSTSASALAEALASSRGRGA